MNIPYQACSIEGCEKKHFGKGFCVAHYAKWRKYGDPLKMMRQQHGMRHSSEYEIWKHIRQRIFDPSNPRHADYGGRGITMYQPWANDFAAFYAYVGPRPSRMHTIDRLRNDEGYEPGNVAWRTYKEQMNNKRNNVVITFGGVTQTATQWAEQIGLGYATLLWRYRQGWPLDRVLDPRIIPHKERKW